MKTYFDFKEIEQEIRQSTPPIIYKFRTWENDDHKRTIIDRQVWFAHPYSLNDPFEMRPPIKYVFEEIDWEIAREKIRTAGRYIEPDLKPEQLEDQVEIRLNQMKQDPIKYLKKNELDYNTDESRYNQIGILSCCLSCENETMWAHYGNNHNGFAVGFNTVELARTLNCSVSIVDYCDDPIEYRPFGKNDDLIGKRINRKSLRWVQEEEIRFVTAGIGISRERVSIFPSHVVSEIVFGIKTSVEVQQAIINETLKEMLHVAFFKMQIKEGSYGLDKMPV